MTELVNLIVEKSEGKLELSRSHNFDHIFRVLDFGLQLQSLYGGDKEVITASILLHDAGRSNKDLHKEDSRILSAQIATRILDAINFPSDKTGLVVKNILEHDQPELSPSTIEGKILKDADFLAGMGAEGILRTVMWTVESGGTWLDLIDRLQNKMRARINGLEFPESKLVAEKQYLLVQLFLDNLETVPQLEPVRALNK